MIFYVLLALINFNLKVKKFVVGVGHGCTACTYSPDQYNEVEVIAAGTELNRSFANNMEVCIFKILKSHRHGLICRFGTSWSAARQAR